MVTCTGHPFANADVVYIVGHTTNTAANGKWTVANKAANTFELAGSVGNGVGGATGTVLLTTEITLSSPAVAGIYTFHVDTVNMAAGDIVELRGYQVTLTGGTLRVAYLMIYYGAQPTDDVEKISVPIGNDLVEAGALKFTLKQTFGVARAFPWKILAY